MVISPRTTKLNDFHGDKYVADLWYPSWFTARTPWFSIGSWDGNWRGPRSGGAARSSEHQVFFSAKWGVNWVNQHELSDISELSWGINTYANIWGIPISVNYPRTIWFILISDVHNSSLICSPNMLVELVLLLLGVVLQLSSSIWWGHAVEGNQYPPVVGRGNGKSPCINDVPSF